MGEGLILVNTGDGKGKTTAALGVALRSAGCGRKVLILQFIKSGAISRHCITTNRRDSIHGKRVYLS